VTGLTRSCVIAFLAYGLSRGARRVPLGWIYFSSFVFSDADKEWYKNYLVAVWPKVARGGCFTAHNVSGRGTGAGIREFLAHLETLPDAVTTLDKTSRAGISISCKR
jgi:predicted O-methyltransferase YrrM